MSCRVEAGPPARADRVLIDVVNVVVLVAFAVDYIIELRLTSDRRAYVRHEWTSAIIVIAQALAVLPGLGPFGLLRALRGVRGIRAAVVLMRLFAIGGASAKEGRTYLRTHAASLALGAAGLTWLTSAAAFTIAEDVGVSGRYESFFDALWWSTETITAVGYGDVFPITTGSSAPTLRPGQAVPMSPGWRPPPGREVRRRGGRSPSTVPPREAPRGEVGSP